MELFWNVSKVKTKLILFPRIMERVDFLFIVMKDSNFSADDKPRVVVSLAYFEFIKVMKKMKNFTLFVYFLFFLSFIRR